MTIVRRLLAFNLVGALGIAVQLGCVWLLTHLAHVPGSVAAAAGVALTVAHNFAWHRNWTWRDRRSGTRAFARFVLSNGAVSLLGSVGIVAALGWALGAEPVAANAVAIAVCGLVNFWLGDAYVFQTQARGGEG